MRSRSRFAIPPLLACLVTMVIACERAGQGARRLADTATAEGRDSVVLATADTYRLRAEKVAPCASKPEPPANWVTHSLPGAPGATLRVPSDLIESVDTMTDGAINSRFANNRAMVQVMFSPRGDFSPGTVLSGCRARIAGYETPLHLYQVRQGRTLLDTIFAAQASFALPNSFGVFIEIAAHTSAARDSLLAVLPSLKVPAQVVRSAPAAAGAARLH